MSRILVIGAGITGGYTAARLFDNGADVSLLARGDKAVRLEKDGLKLRDGIAESERSICLPIVREPVEKEYDIVMVCVQEIHRPSIEDLLADIPGRPVIWYLGNTAEGYNRAADRLGRERILGGFPDMGGTWDEDVLLYADRYKPKDKPFNNLIAGAAFPEAKPALDKLIRIMSEYNQNVVSYEPIMAWHLCHLALVLPLAGISYIKGGDLREVISDRVLLKKAMRAVVQGLKLVRKKGYPVLPGRLKMMSYIPSALGARKLAQTLGSPFGAIALAGHAATARNEMKRLAEGFLKTCGPGDKSTTESFSDLLELLAEI